MPNSTIGEVPRLVWALMVSAWLALSQKLTNRGKAPKAPATPSSEQKADAAGQRPGFLAYALLALALIMLALPFVLAVYFA